MRLTVLGAGAWGTTLASLAAPNADVTLWARDADVAAELGKRGTNSSRLLGRALPNRFRATADLEAALARADVVVFAVPAPATREVAELAAPHVQPWVPVVSVAKGLEPSTGLRPTQVLSEAIPGHPVALLAGPTLVGDILEGHAAAAVVVTPDEHVARALQPLFSGPLLRIYRNEDLVGAELGAALKNVVAIGVGIVQGLDAGDNLRAIGVARGLAEITRLGVALGARAETFAGLSGLGDLTATCMSPGSRNRRVGEALGRGADLDATLADLGHPEGVTTARPAVELAREHGVVMSISTEIDAVLNEGRPVAEAFRGLVRRDAQHEGDASDR